jgi:hypothetical protein
MMGRQRRDQGRLFYAFRLDDRIPKNHLLRRIDVFVTAAVADLHQELEPHYSDIGRPSAAEGDHPVYPGLGEERSSGRHLLARADFIWDKRHGYYICPNGEPLRTSGRVHDGRTLLYRASKRDCDVCLLRPRCCTRDEARKILGLRARARLGAEVTSKRKPCGRRSLHSLGGPQHLLPFH